MEGKIEKASLPLQHFCGRMAFLLGHVLVLVERMLSNTSRANQGIPCAARHGMTEKFRGWLQTNPVMRLRSVEAITISISCAGASPHYDSQNDSRKQFDHICWAVNYHNNLHKILSPASCLTLTSNGIDPATRVAFTFIAYTRAVIGSQTDLVSNVSRVECPLFKCFTAELNNDAPNRQDVGNLIDESRRQRFFDELQSLRWSDIQNDYKSDYALRTKTLTRDVERAPSFINAMAEPVSFMLYGCFDSIWGVLDMRQPKIMTEMKYQIQ
jgi:hypothetical protein